MAAALVPPVGPLVDARALSPCSSCPRCSWAPLRVLRHRLGRVRGAISSYEQEPAALDSRAPSQQGRWRMDNMLAAGETVIVVLGAASQLTSHFRLHTSPASTLEPAVCARHQRFSSLQILLLWAAVLVNAIARVRAQQGSSSSGVAEAGPEESRGPEGSLQLAKRVASLEQDLRGSLVLTRGVSRQLAKLGIRVRATRQTLRDPIQASAAVARITSEAVTAVASRQDLLEAQLRGVEEVLVAMQEQQGKLFQLLGFALKRKIATEQEHLKTASTRPKVSITLPN